MKGAELGVHFLLDLLTLGRCRAYILATRSTSWESSSRLQIAGNRAPGARQRISSGDDMFGSFVRRVARSRNKIASLKLVSRTSARRGADRGCTFQFSDFGGMDSRCL